MRSVSRRTAAVTAATAAGILALGGVTAAWAAPALVNESSRVHADQWHGTPQLSGTVASVATSSFQLTETGGTPVTVDTTSSTTYSETGTTTAPTGVTAGERVSVEPAPGTTSGATTVTAQRVTVVLTQVSGTVQTVGSGSFAVQTPGGLMTTVDTTGSTTYSENGTTETGVTAGQSVTAFGAPDATDPSQLDAQSVDIHTAPTAPDGGSGHGRRGFPSWTGLSGTVASVATGSFQLTETGGTPVTVDTTSSTTYSETGTTTAPTGVTAGERVSVEPAPGTTSGATTVTAQRVTVVLTQVSGTVQTVGSGSFAVQTPGGLMTTVDTTGSTTYSENGTTETGVTAGQSVTAFGAPDATDPSQLDAQSVDIHTMPPASGGSWGHGGPGGTWHPPSGPPSAWSVVTGTVKSVTGDDVVVARSSGTTTTVVVSSSTHYFGPSAAQGVAAVTVGATVAAFGTTDASGDLDATGIVVGSPPPVHPGSGPWAGDGSGGSGGSTTSTTTPWTPPVGTTPGTDPGHTGGWGPTGGSGSTTTSTTSPSGGWNPGGSHGTGSTPSGSTGSPGSPKGAPAGSRGAPGSWS